MFCKYCGKEIKDGASFCTSCGKSVASPAVQSAPQAVPPRQEPPRPAPSAPPVAPPQERTDAYQPRSHSNVGLIVLICVLGAVAVAAVLLLFTPVGNFLWNNTLDNPVSASPSSALQTEAESSPAPVATPSATTSGQSQSSYPLQLDMDDLMNANLMGSTFREAWQDGWLEEWMYLYVNGSSDGPSPYAAYWYDSGLREWTYYGITYSQAAEAGWGDIWLDLVGDRDGGTTTTAPSYTPTPGGYLLPTNSRYIDKSELYRFSREELQLVRNEIYARYGYVFNTPSIQAYFDAQPWYVANPSVNASTFSMTSFNTYESANLDIIVEYEQEMGW